MLSGRVRREGDAFRFIPTAMGQRLRVVLLSSDSPHHDFLASELSESLEVCLRVVEPSVWQQHDLARRGKWIDWLARGWHVHRERLTGRRRYRREYFSALTDPDRVASVRTLVIRSVNDDEVVRALERVHPDVTVVCGTMYIKRYVLERSGLTLNVHGGYLPDYRGNHAIFFAYYRGDYGKVASTIHLVTPQLDAGEIVDVVYPDVYPHDTDEHLYCRAVQAAIERLDDLLVAFERGAPLVCRPQPYEGVLYRHRSRSPAHEFAAWLRRRLLGQSPRHIPASRRLAGPHQAEHAFAASDRRARVGGL